MALNVQNMLRDTNIRVVELNTKKAIGDEAKHAKMLKLVVFAQNMILLRILSLGEAGLPALSSSLAFRPVGLFH